MRKKTILFLITACLSMVLNVPAAGGKKAFYWDMDTQSSVSPLGGISLSPASTDTPGCAREVQIHTLTVSNATGSPVVMNLTYTIISGDGTCGGPATTGTIADSASQEVDVFFYPDCTPGGSVTCDVTVQNGIYSGTATISTGCALTGTWSQVGTEPDDGRMDNVVTTYNNRIWSVTGYGLYGLNADVRTYNPELDAWTAIADSAPPFGSNHARSGCRYGSKVYIYGDSFTDGFTGLWSYDMDSNTWFNESPSGTPPDQAGIWAPAWASDPETGYCYLTGGATSPGAGNLSTVYVYNPASNAWLPQLPNFTSVRDFHATFIYTSAASGYKLLCVAGGNDGAAMDSTQCYDFAGAAWNVENADLGMLPEQLWGMGYTDRRHKGTDDQLWVIAGSGSNLYPTRHTYFYDVNTGTWEDGGPLESGAVYRGSAAALGNEIYKFGGASSSFMTRGWTDHLTLCKDCEDISFSDIPSGYWAENFIYAIACEGITTGYPDGAYQPATAVNRAQMAAFIIRALFGEDFTYDLTPHFTDVPSVHWAFKYIQKMYEEGITTGYDDGTYRAENEVNRAQMSSFLTRSLFGETFPFAPAPYFIDVGSGYWAFEYIQKLFEERITTGYEDGTYRPEFTVNRAQMATFLGRAYLDMK